MAAGSSTMEMRVRVRSFQSSQTASATTCTGSRTSEGRQEGCHGFFVACLVIRDLGIRLGTCYIGGKAIELGKLCDCGTDHAEFGRTDRCSTFFQIKCSC